MRVIEQELRPRLISTEEAARLLRQGRLGARIESLARLAAAVALEPVGRPEARA